MSRCFPFPPPGYEEKARPDHVNLIIKERHKEKKHKEKKDKDKKERIEKKEKEKSEDRHREKERKDKKHGEKKEKKKDKDIQEDSKEREKKIVGSLKHQSSERLGPIGEEGNAIKESNFLFELEKRINNDNEVTNSQMDMKLTPMDKKGITSLRKVEKINGGILVEAHEITKESRSNSTVSSGHCWKPSENTEDKREHAGMVNGQSIGIAAMGLGNGATWNYGGQDQKEIGRHMHDGKEGEEKNKPDSNDGKRNEKENGDQDKKHRSLERRMEKEERDMEKSSKRSKEQIEQRESHYNVLHLAKESNDREGNNGKLKKPNLEGSLLENGHQPNKPSRHGASSEQVRQNRFQTDAVNHVSIPDADKAAALRNHKYETQVSSSQSVENIKKLGHSQSLNGFKHEQSGATKNHGVSHFSSVSCVYGIGRNMGPCQTARSVGKVREGINNDQVASVRVLSSSVPMVNGKTLISKPVEWQDVVISQKMNSKGCQMNGVVDTKRHNSLSAASASINVKDNVVKPPHPDSKYLSRIYTVPNVEWPVFDDQEWLFDGEDSRAKRPKLVSTQDESMKQVWAEAVRFVSDDVIALPYVLPY